MEMRSLEAAVAYLEQAGLNAGLRTWAMGQTVRVFLDPHGSVGGIQTFGNVMYIVPELGSGWRVDEEVHPTLRAACDAIIGFSSAKKA